MADERVLVTGGTGCIGSWVVRNLIREGIPVVVLSVDRQFDRLKLVLTDEEFAGSASSITDIAEHRRRSRPRRVDSGINRIIHLAAMQFPFCAADPIRGAQVNVAGHRDDLRTGQTARHRAVVYASSAAVYGPASHYAEADPAGRMRRSSRRRTTASTRSRTRGPRACTGRTTGSRASDSGRIRSTGRGATRA